MIYHIVWIPFVAHVLIWKFMSQIVSYNTVQYYLVFLRCVVDYQTGGTSTIGSNNLFPDLLRPSPQGPKISVPRNSGLPIQIELDVSVSRYIQISDKEKNYTLH